MDKLEWALSLDDEISGPGRKMAGALDNVDKKLKTTGDTSERVTTRMAQGARKAAEAHSFLALQVDALMNIAGRTAGFLERIGHQAYDFGAYAVKAAAFKEDTLTALEAVLGSKKAALAVFKEGAAFAARTPFETQDVERWQKQLLVGGYTAKETTVLLKALSDVGAFNEFRPDVVDRLADAMTRLRGEGRLAGDVMRELRGAGVQDGRVYAELNKIFGTTTIQTKALMEAGRIDANAGIVAVVRAIAGIGGGVLGAMTDKSSTNVTGLLSTLRSRPFELLMDLDTSPGYETLRKFLQKAANVFDPNSAFGTRIKNKLQDTISGAFVGIFGNLNSVSEESLVDGLTKGIDVVAGLGKAAWAGVGAAVEAALGNAKGLWEELTGPNRQAAFDRITKSAEHFGTVIGELGTRVLKLAEHMNGLLDTTNKVFEGWDYILNPMKYNNSLYVGADGKVHKQDSSVNDRPSSALTQEALDRVHRVALANGFGQTTSRSAFNFTNNPFADPMDFIRDMPNKPVSSSKSDAHLYAGARAEAMTISAPNASYVSPAMVRTSARSGGHQVQVTVAPQIVIQGVGDPRAVATEVLQRIRHQLPSEILAVFEQLNLELGG